MTKLNTLSEQLAESRRLIEAIEADVARLRQILYLQEQRTKTHAMLALGIDVPCPQKWPF